MYGTLDLADAYHEARASAGWTGTDDAKEAALLRASVWLDATYGSRFPGIPTGGRDQARQWPRTGAYDVYGREIPTTEVPAEVLSATYEAAMRELALPGSLSPDYVASAAVVREKVGPLEVEYSGAFGASSVTPALTIVDGLLAPIIGRSGGMNRLLRA